ncbi:MAG: hypothetical protein M1829_003305 [Trizodia sp. TS-e1964]|nr:MAG: hypothetical protein M1829_003305 [Trizodia sp. TS-e1964]
MSSLEKSLDAFQRSVKASSALISNKRSVAPVVVATSTPPPASPATSTAEPAVKKRRIHAAGIVYSQPADTGTGQDIMTQVTYAVDYLKNKEAAQTFEQIIGYLSLGQESDRARTLQTILRRNPQVEFLAASKSYRFRPKHNIRNGEELQRFLQAQVSAHGLSVKELKDGWTGAEDAIDKLEKEKKILVTRNKKDNHSRMVWANDPSLSAYEIDIEFQILWHKIAIPQAADLPAELTKAGLIPTSADPASLNKTAKKEVKKRKKPRKGGRTTNTHMQGILKDYSSRH